MGTWNFPLAEVGGRGRGGQPQDDWVGQRDHRCGEKGLGGVDVREGIRLSSSANRPQPPPQRPASPQGRVLWCGRYLAGSDDESVLVLVLELFGVVQFLPADTHGHHAQLVVRAEVVGVLCLATKQGSEIWEPSRFTARQPQLTEQSQSAAAA